MCRINDSLLLFALLLSTACSQQLKPAQPSTAFVNKPVPAIAVSSRPKPLSAHDQLQFAKAKQLMQQQDFANAADLLQNIVARQADFTGVWYNLAVCQWQLNQASEAEYSLQLALAAAPENSASKNLLGILAREQGQFGQAEQYWLQVVQASDTAAAHKNLGILYELYLGQLTKAQRHYQRYFELSQDPQAKVWLTLINRQLSAKEPADAEKAL